MPAGRRDHLIETAMALFRRDGFHATGIDKILNESGCAKMTLYNHFRSKDDLILAALRRRDETFRNWFVRRVEAAARTPRGRLLAVFDVLDEWFQQPDFGGCMFINASAEFGEAGHPAHLAAAEHKRLMLAYLLDLAQRAGAKDARALAESLTLLSEGAIVAAHVTGDKQAARRGRAAAAVLLADALPAEGTGAT